MTLYSNGGKIYDWSSDPVSQLEIGEDEKERLYIKKGDPLTCEYRTISVVSNKFDKWTASEIMLVNYVKNSITSKKDRAMESITYYDDDFVTETVIIGGEEYRKAKIGPFDSSEYGHPVCFHTPGYKGSTINITTKMWEVNENTALKKVLESVKQGIGMVGTATASPYLNIASTAFGISSQILVGYVKHEELCKNHTLELRMDSDNHPLLVGKYICIPGLRNLNKKKNILENYFLKDNILVRFDEEGKYREYVGTYFVIKVTNDEREDLTDFDFTASSADLLGKINTGTYSPNEMANSVLKIQRDAHDLGLIKTVQNDYSTYMKAVKNMANADEIEDYKNELIASYRQLNGSSDNSREWFDANFPEIKLAI